MCNDDISSDNSSYNIDINNNSINTSNIDNNTDDD